MFHNGSTYARFQCWICDTPVDQPVYWIDPRDYDVGETKTLCGPECALRAYEQVRHTFKPRPNPEDSQ
jgi:hypothetical protein